MLFGGFLLAALTCAAPQTTVERPSIQVAVTQSGLRVEVLKAQAGDLRVLTPFGHLMLVGDPVVAVEEGGAQLEALLALHAQGVLDDLGLAQDLSTAGQLTALAEHARAFALASPESVEPFLILESWGARIDPVPDDCPYEQRVDWLWQRIMDDDWATTVLCAAWLRGETSAAYQAPSERVVSIVDLRRGLRSRLPAQRRAAGLIAGRQQEYNLLEPLLSNSLDDPIAGGADGAARGCSEVYPQASLDCWSRVLAHGETGPRLRAARHLGAYSGRSGLKVLTHVLAAAGRPNGDRFTFAGRDIFVMARESAEPFDFRLNDIKYTDKLLIPSDPQREYVDLGSRFKVTRVEPEVVAMMLAALDVWAGEVTGRSREDWLLWYLENLQPGDVRDS
jgi:hypothetical protein